MRGTLDNYYAQHHKWPSGNTAQIHQQLGLPENIQSDYIQSLLVDQDGTIQVQFTDLIDGKASLTMSPIQLTNEAYIIWSCKSTLTVNYQACVGSS